MHALTNRILLYSMALFDAGAIFAHTVGLFERILRYDSQVTTILAAGRRPQGQKTEKYVFEGRVGNALD